MSHKLVLLSVLRGCILGIMLILCNVCYVYHLVKHVQGRLLVLAVLVGSICLMVHVVLLVQMVLLLLMVLLTTATLVTLFVSHVLYPPQTVLPVLPLMYTTTAHVNPHVQQVAP